MHKLGLFLAIAALCAAGAAPAFAVPITFTEQATGTGSFGGTPFTNATVELALTTDTADISSFPPLFFFTPLETMSLQVDSLPTASLTAIAATAVGGAAGFNSGGSQRRDILATQNSLLIPPTYHLRTPLGPIAG